MVSIRHAQLDRDAVGEDCRASSGGPLRDRCDERRCQRVGDHGGGLPRRRHEEKLGELELLPHRDDALGSVTNLFTKQSDWITFHTTVSTSDVDNEGKPQIAISPGYLQADWHKDGRHYFSYDMGQVKTLDFFNFVSARYDVKRVVYPGAAGPEIAGGFD